MATPFRFPVKNNNNEHRTIPVNSSLNTIWLLYLSLIMYNH